MKNKSMHLHMYETVVQLTVMKMSGMRKKLKDVVDAEDGSQCGVEVPENIVHRLEMYHHGMKMNLTT